MNTGVVMSIVKLYCENPTNTSQDKIILANFTNGELIADRCQELKFSHFSKPDTRHDVSYKQRILVAESDRVRYVGHNFGGGSTSLPKPMYRYMIGIHTPNSKRMRLIDSDLFTMKPSFPDDLDQRSLGTPDLPGDKHMSFRQKTDRLVSSFGSSKRKRTVNSRLQSKLDTDVVQSTLGQVAGMAVDSGVLDKNPAASETYDEMSFIPSCNKDATSVIDVYQLTDIISSQDVEALREAAEVFTQATREQLSQWNTDKTYCLFILKQLQHLPSVEPARSTKASQLLYLHYMISVFHMKPKDFFNKPVFPRDWPLACITSLRERYIGTMGGASSKANLFMSHRHKDRLAAHILVACLIMEEFVLPLTDMRSELRFSPIKINYLMQMIGCRVKRKTEAKTKVDVAHLELPLVFPKPRKIIMSKRQYFN